jgi:hypothetical protein
MITLRPRQERAIHDLRAAFDAKISPPSICWHRLAAIRVSPCSVSAGTRRSANTRKRERRSKGFLIEAPMANRRLDLAGKIFGRLTVIQFHHVDIRTFWLCRCECGKDKIASGPGLVAGVTKSCGCLQREAVIRNAKLATRAKSLPYPHARRLCNLFEDMRKRCLVPTTRCFDSYGGRGITICAEWLTDRRAFYAWATANGYLPELEVDRIDVNGNYEPGNCRFISRAEQHHNTRRSVFVEWNGRRQTATQWALELGWKPAVILKRLQQGWPIEKALTQLPRGVRGN